MYKLSREFFLRDGLTVARELIGKVLVHNNGGVRISGIISETEAYLGPEDRAAHAWRHRGREGRTAVLYKDGGLAYVYMIYGMYYCLNASANIRDAPECALLRGVIPLEGTDGNINGPGKLCRAFGINRKFNGTDLTGGFLYIEDSWHGRYNVNVTKRVNIDYAKEAKDLPYRFVIADNLYKGKVSK